MFKRLFVLLLLVAATVSASTPVRASTLSVEFYCLPFAEGRLECFAQASGGASSSYQYVWSPTPFAGDGPNVLIYCQPGGSTWVSVTVTEGAETATSEGWTGWC